MFDKPQLVAAFRRNAASPDNDKPAPGQLVRITGTIEDVRNAAAAFNDQQVYIRAEHVTPEG